MSRILITGATGFIGSNLTKELVNLGHEVFALVRYTSNPHEPFNFRNSENFQVRIGDLTDHHVIQKIISEISPNYIFHIGAYTPVRNSFDEPIVYQDINYLGTINLINAARNIHDFKNFIFASTMETYGWQEQRTPFTEDLPLNPASPYAVAKVASEKYLHMIHKRFGFPFIALKPCNTYGRTNNTSFITEYLLTTMLKNQTVYVGQPDSVRDLMYVSDHVNGYIKALESDVTGESINIGTGNQINVGELAKKIAGITDYRGEIIHSYPPGYARRPLQNEPDFLSLDATKAKNLLGWEPKHSLDAGLSKIAEFWKNKLKE